MVQDSAQGPWLPLYGSFPGGDTCNHGNGRVSHLPAASCFFSEIGAAPSGVHLGGGGDGARRGPPGSAPALALGPPAWPPTWLLGVSAGGGSLPSAAAAWSRAPGTELSPENQEQSPGQAGPGLLSCPRGGGVGAAYLGGLRGWRLPDRAAPPQPTRAALGTPGSARPPKGQGTRARGQHG